ncbi:DUF4123 domain-containing protein [Morganella morganii]|uniref:DUF4123 domain-containing protein n=2 Tax=Morganella morganii TaxID=582 RepID=UPI00339C82C6
MTETTWCEWIKQAAGDNTYFLLNKLAQPDPVVQFYAADWVEESYPLYAGTPLSHLKEQGPWLIKAKRKNFGNLAKALDADLFEDLSWGWAYHSTESYEDQIAHWQRQHIVLCQREESVLRLFDNRIAGALIPAFTPADWSYLLMPLNDCFITYQSGNRCFVRPSGAEKKINVSPYKLGEHILLAWEKSAQFRINTIDNFYIQFWEQHSDLALALEEPEGNLVGLINQCMDYYQADLVDIGYLTNAMFIHYLKQNNLIGNGQEYAI